MQGQYKHTELSLISHFQIRGWLAEFKEQKHTPRSINRKLSSLNSYYKYLMRHGYAEKNPVRQLHAQRLPERLPTYMKEQETQQLLEEVSFGEGFKGFTDRLVCELLYSTGIRRNELLELKENDIEWSLNQVRILGKGNKERLIPVSPILLDDLRDYMQEKRKLEQYDAHHLLNLENGRPLYAGYVYRIVKQYMSTTTTLKKKSPHVLRHTFATHLLNNGANIQAIKDLLGHSSLAATQVYTHNNIDKLKEIHKHNHPRG
jgi:integrase/recombinase XerC